ncbi:FAD binding domain-containing protein, partial [Armillaria mellea]
TFELFQHLSVIDDIQKLVMPIDTMHTYKLPGGTVPVKSWDLYEKKYPGPILNLVQANGACLGQDLLEGIIHDHLSKYGISTELNKGLVAIEQDPTDVTVTVAIFRNGVPTNGKEEIVAQYLIRSDGAKGNSRKSLGLTFQGEMCDVDSMVWGDITIKGLMSKIWHIWGKPGHFTLDVYAFIPSFGIGITGQNFDFTHLANPAKAVEFIKAEMGCIDLEFWEFTWLSHFRPNMWMVNKFQEGRAFVVGDSAHVHSPTGGQGMNCSIQDASNLTWKLSLVLKGLASPTLLSTYNKEHLLVITQILHVMTQLYTNTIVNKHPTKDTKEDEKASGWFWWRNTALEVYGINYQYNSIVQEEQDTKPQDAEDILVHAYSGYEGQRSLHAGDQAPDALLRGTTLFSLFKSMVHTVLIFSKWSMDLEVILKTLPVQTFIIANVNSSLEGISVLVDGDGHARKAYMVEEDSLTIVIVRPDSFIGAIITDVKGVEQYFSKILI